MENHGWLTTWNTGTKPVSLFLMVILTTRMISMITKKWDRYGGPEGGANSFEEMLIAVADDVKSAFGDFNFYDSFMTDAESKNHEDVEPMFFEPVSDKPGYKSITFNDEYVRIGQGLTNLRWLKWFMDTDYAKENWNSQLNGWKVLVSKIDELEPGLSQANFDFFG